MTEHTPGPWLYRAMQFDDWGWIRGPGTGNPLVACARSGRFDTGAELDEHRRNETDPYEANARLIAAAPDMLAALYEVACPRPANAVSEGVSLTVRECIGRNECGCTFGIAVKKATETAIERAGTKP